MSNIVPLHYDIDIPGKNAEPNKALVAILEDMLERARAGVLLTFVGTGFTREGGRVAVFDADDNDVYKTAGALAWLEREYMQSVELRLASNTQEEHP